MTLVGGIPYSTDVSSLLDILRSGISSWSQSEKGSSKISFVKTGRKDIYFQSLFMHCSLSPALSQLRLDLLSKLQDSGVVKADVREYMPHLSVLYSSKVTESQKDDLIRLLQDKYKLSEEADGASLDGISNFEAS